MVLVLTLFSYFDFCYLLGQISYKVGQIQILFCDMISIHDMINVKFHDFVGC